MKKSKFTEEQIIAFRQQDKIHPIVTPVIVDCDPGLDDAAALLLAANSPELKLLAVTTVAGNRPIDVTTQNACDILELAGREDVDVYAGSKSSLTGTDPVNSLVFGDNGLGEVKLTKGRHTHPLHACEMLSERLIKGEPGSITIIALGPLTNLATIERSRPGILRRARKILCMGGAYRRSGNITPSAEFNFYVDPIAANLVLRSGADIHLFGLDVTARVRLDSAWVDEIPEDTPANKSIKEIFAAHLATDPVLHDICPVAFALRPDYFGEGERVHCSVDESGSSRGRSVLLNTASQSHASLNLHQTADGSVVLRLLRRCIRGHYHD